MNGLKIANNLSKSVQVSYFRCLEFIQENLKDLNENNNLSLLNTVNFKTKTNIYSKRLIRWW